MKNSLKVVTRSSKLALKQVDEIAEKISGIKLDVVSVQSMGDKNKKLCLMKNRIDDFFTRELDQMIINKNCDIAIHSAKDLPEILDKDLRVVYLSENLDNTDTFVSLDRILLKLAPKGFRIGVSSKRRKDAVLAINSKVKIVSIRGNIEERIRLIEEKVVDGIVIATCALKRLGLITVKGMKVLKKADVVLYDFLSSLELLKYTKKSCETICVGKKDGLHLKEQNEINELLFELAREHKIVVRLKGGDPFIFSRGYEEASFLSGKGLAVEIVPGITSAIAAGESFGIPLTIKNKISSVAIVTGRKHDKNAKIDAPDCATLIYLMGVTNIANIVDALRESGRKDDTPCAFVEKVYYKDTRLIEATIGTIEQKTKEFNVKAPSVLIVGEVVKKGLYKQCLL